MNIPTNGVRIILIVLYVVAVWVRLSGSDPRAHPYFAGESGTHYRHANLVRHSGSLPPVDLKSGWPEGTSPSQIQPNGVEYLVAFSYRLVALFSDISLQRYAGLLTVLFFSLAVFTFYLLTFSLWGGQAAGVLAALFVAFSAPLVSVTDTREFLHAPYAVVLISLHLSLLLGNLTRTSTARSIMAALVAITILATWEGAGLYLGIVGLAVTMGPGFTVGARRRIIVAHLVGVVAAALLLPHLRAQRFIFAWPVIFFLVAAAYYYLGARLPRRVPSFFYIVTGSIILTLVLRPLHSGGIEMLSWVEYGLYRLRFVSGKPEAPGALSDAARFLWTHGRSHPNAFALFQFFLPLLFLAPLAIVAIRAMRRQAMVIWPAIALAVVGTVLFLFDRSAVFAAALGLFPLAAAGACSVGSSVRSRTALISVASVLIVTQSTFGLGKANATFQIASRVGLSPIPDRFIRVSIGNADRELVRHLVSRTPVKDPILALPDISSLLVSVAGKTVVLVPGVRTMDNASRTSATTALFYGNEETLFEQCESLGVQYVLYSIDILLDESNYSPRYVAGITKVDEAALAYKMHFFPEALRHFNLVYQNDNYRLFKVTKETEPLFLTDHPVVYQESILQGRGDSLRSFYDSVVDILVTYQTAVDAQAKGEESNAISRFRYCLEQAPFFTKAWLGVGDSMLRLREFEAANAAYMRVLNYSPDNTHALYYAALTFAHLDRKKEALGLLEVLLATGGERELLSLAAELRAVIKSGVPLDRPEGSQ